MMKNDWNFKMKNKQTIYIHQINKFKRCEWSGHFQLSSLICFHFNKLSIIRRFCVATRIELIIDIFKWFSSGHNFRAKHWNIATWNGCSHKLFTHCTHFNDEFRCNEQCPITYDFQRIYGKNYSIFSYKKINLEI